VDEWTTLVTAVNTVKLQQPELKESKASPSYYFQAMKPGGAFKTVAQLVSKSRSNVPTCTNSDLTPRAQIWLHLTRQL